MGAVRPSNGSVATLLLLLCCRLAAATAAEEPGDAQPAVSRRHAVLEEVIVTVQRRKEPLQQVPVAATALSAEQIDRLQIVNLGMLQYVAPSLTIAPSQTSRTSASIAMRGQFVRDTAPTVDPAVGLYLDGVYIARMTGANLDLIDLERVEVLRGPQGTLYGRNTIGGAINLIPRPPQFALESVVAAGAGNYDRVDLSATANVPFAGDALAARVTLYHTEHAGYGRNVLLGVDLDDDATDFVRTQLRFVPADDWDFILSFDHTQVRSGSQLRTLLAVSSGASTIPGLLGHPDDNLDNYVDPVGRSVALDRDGATDSTVWGTSGTLTVDLDRFTIKSMTAYRALDSTAFDSDQDGTPYDLGVIVLRDDHQHQFSQEIQLQGVALDDRLQWIGGLHYFDESATFDQRFRVFVPATARWSENLPSGDASNSSVAAYAQFTHAISPRLGMTLGARYNEDRRQLTSRNARLEGDTEICRLDPALRDEPGLCRATLAERRFSYAPWTLGLDYRPVEATLLYAEVSRGHRSGGYNIRGATEADLGTFEPEHVTVYEIGAKTELLDRRLRLNLALFRSLFDAIQVSQREAAAPGVPGTAFIENGGEARIDGGELEVTALLGTLQVGAAIGIVQPAFTKLDPRVEEITLHSRFLHTPDQTASLVVDQPVAVGWGEINLHGDYSWRDDVSFSYDPHSPARQDAYGLLNVMLSARLDRASLELSLWARNLTDKRYITRAFESDFYISAIPGDPRTYGLSLTYHFDDR